MACNAGIILIPDDLSALSKLELLRLDSCKGIKHFRSCLASLKSLRQLSLNYTTGFSHVDSINLLKLDKLSLRFVDAGSAVVACHFPCLSPSERQHFPIPAFSGPCILGTLSICYRLAVSWCWRCCLNIVLKHCSHLHALIKQTVCSGRQLLLVRGFRVRGSRVRESRVRGSRVRGFRIRGVSAHLV